MQRAVALRVAILAFAALLGAARANADATPDRKLDFNRDVRPILSNSCYACHGPDSGKRKGDPPLRLDIKAGLFGDRDGSAPVTPGKPDESLIILRTTSDDPDVHMPPPKSTRPQPTKQQLETL